MDLVGGTTTGTGLKVRCERDTDAYPKGVAVSDEDMAAINIVRTGFRSKCNCTINPVNRSDRAVDS